MVLLMLHYQRMYDALAIRGLAESTSERGTGSTVLLHRLQWNAKRTKYYIY